MQRAAATLVIAASCLAASDLRLVDAVKRRDEKAVASLIRQRADVNAAQPDGATALGWAAHLGAEETAELLLAAGANVNVADEYGETPLTLACANGDASLVRRLLKAGADAKAARWDGETAPPGTGCGGAAKPSVPSAVQGMFMNRLSGLGTSGGVRPSSAIAANRLSVQLSWYSLTPSKM